MSIVPKNIHLDDKYVDEVNLYDVIENLYIDIIDEYSQHGYLVNSNIGKLTYIIQNNIKIKEIRNTARKHTHKSNNKQTITNEVIMPDDKLDKAQMEIPEDE